MAKRINKTAKDTARKTTTSKKANTRKQEAKRRTVSAKESWEKCKTRVEAAKKVKAAGIHLANNAAKKHLVEIMDARRAYARVYGTQLHKNDRKKLHKQPGQAKKIASAKKLLTTLASKYGYNSVREAWDTAKAYHLFERQQ